MPSTKKLLSITNLKKYFPIAKNSIFQRERLYVRANEEITLDIHDGETIGIVGESGCGKSTLGRVLLQLYEQTAGNTMYYGRSASEIAPKYIEETLKQAPKYIKKYKDLQAKADKLEAECAQLGEGASFFQLQNKNLAVANARSAFMNVAKILGGFMVVEDVNQGAEALLKRHSVDVEIAKNKKKQASLLAEVELYNAEIENATDKKSKEAFEKKLTKTQDKLQQIDTQLTALQQKRAVAEEELLALKATYADDKEFQKHEEYLDDGIDLARLKYNEMRFLRKDLQIIFQDPYSSLDPRMTIGQIIEEGLVTHNFYKHGSPKMQEHILQTMRDCGLQDYMLHRYPHQFSGGQRQRICIARALAIKPKFVVCDECVSALDVSIQSQIINLLQELQEREKFTYLFISHNLSLIKHITDHMAVMYLGEVMECGATEEIFKNPATPYTKALMSAIPKVNPSRERERIILSGEARSPINPPDICRFTGRCPNACEICHQRPLSDFVSLGTEHMARCHMVKGGGFYR